VTVIGTSDSKLYFSLNDAVEVYLLNKDQKEEMLINYNTNSRDYP